MKKTTYYILAVDYGSGYGVEFGSYNRAEVIDEQSFQQHIADYSGGHKSKVIETIEDQTAINAEIKKLNNNNK